MQELDLVKLIVDRLGDQPRDMDLLLPVPVAIIPEEHKIGIRGLSGAVEARQAVAPYGELTETVVSEYKYDGPVERLCGGQWLFNRLLYGRQVALAVFRPRQLLARNLQLELLTDEGWRMFKVDDVHQLPGEHERDLARGLYSLCWHQQHAGDFELDNEYQLALQRARQSGDRVEHWRYFRGDIAVHAMATLGMAHDDIPKVVSFNPKFSALATATVHAKAWTVADFSHPDDTLADELQRVEPGVSVEDMVARMDGVPGKALLYILRIKGKQPAVVAQDIDGITIEELTIPRVPRHEEVEFASLSLDDLSNGTLTFCANTGRTRWDSADGSRMAWLPIPQIQLTELDADGATEPPVPEPPDPLTTAWHADEMERARTDGQPVPEPPDQRADDNLPFVQL